MEGNINFAISERDELILGPLKHILKSNASNPNVRHICLSPLSWD